MANPTQKYYNRRANSDPMEIPGYEINKMRMANRYGSGTEKQKALYYSLLNFCKKYELFKYGLREFERPKNASDASRKIKSMFSIIRRHGLYDKYWEEVHNAEQQRQGEEV